MDLDTAELALAIGARVRAERQTRRWTLDQLAAAAGVSRRMVVNVEQGSVNPSVGTLLRLSEALGVGLPALVELPRKPLEVTRRGDGAVLWRGEFGGRALLVAGTEGPDVVELWDWTMEPGDRHVSDAHPVGTRELVHVHSGSLTVEVAGEPVRLAKGDALSFPGDVAHSYESSTTVRTKFSLAVSEPGVGTTVRSGAHDA